MNTESGNPRSACASRRLKRRASVLTDVLPDGYVILYVEETNWAFTLTPLGALVWEFCDGEMTLDEVVTAIGETDCIVRDDGLGGQVEALTAELERLGLLVPATADQAEWPPLRDPEVSSGERLGWR